MTSEERIAQDIEPLRADFASLGDGPFQHFFCPILLKDEKTELCLGHVINKEIPNSRRTTIVQRKDVDGFYGSLVESRFTALMRAEPKEVSDIFLNPKLSKVIPWNVQIDGRPVEHYVTKQGEEVPHPVVRFQDGQVEVFRIALKASEQDLPSTGRLEIVVDQNYIPEAVATLLKAAHLTMFKLQGYRYVFSPAGQMLGGILRDFYLENSIEPRAQQAAATKSYFQKHAGMVLPLMYFDENVLKGSIEDCRFMLCVGSSGMWFALGVFIRTGHMMHVVFLPNDEAESIGTYFDFVGEMNKKSFCYQFLDYIAAGEGESEHWQGYQKEYLFEPGAVGEVVT